MKPRKLRNDLTGKVFGRLTVIGRDMTLGVIEGKKTRVHWVCKCECGNTTSPRGDALTSDRTTSCGCVHMEALTTHGMRNTQIYQKWIGMRSRCNDPNQKMYPRYGGRGITVCGRWDSFEKFYSDVGNPPTKTHQLDRIDNDGNYEPSNVHWATPKQNSNNRSTSYMITHEGRTLNFLDWAKLTGISKSTIQYRYHHGWPVEKILRK